MRDALTAYLDWYTWRVVAARKLRKDMRMGKLGEIADRIAEKKKCHDAKADEWAKRLDAIDKREPEAFAIGDSVIEERETDLHQMESDLRKLSNLPLASQASSAGSQAAQGQMPPQQGAAANSAPAATAESPSTHPHANPKMWP